jgi:hypothetical protein
MVSHLAGGRSLPGKVVDHIVAKADGVALYVEELTKAILASGVPEVRGDAYVLMGSLRASGNNRRSATAVARPPRRQLVFPW